MVIKWVRKVKYESFVEQNIYNVVAGFHEPIHLTSLTFYEISKIEASVINHVVKQWEPVLAVLIHVGLLKL